MNSNTRGFGGKFGGRNYSQIVLLGLALLGAWIVLSGSFYVVGPNEVAGVRRLGTVASATPVMPGPHFKLPLIDKVDLISVSVDHFQLEDFEVHTIDNQPVTVSLGITYRVPTESAFRLLYQVGRPGNTDINSNIRPIIADRAMKVFARRNTINISDERQQIGAEIEQSVSEVLQQLFGLKIIDTQISKISYANSFVDSINNAMKAKNEAVAAENKVAQFSAEGEQKVVTAKAEAEAQVARAEAAKQSSILAAEGESEAIKLKGNAQAEAIKVKGQAIRENPRLIDLTIAENWRGEVPATVMGSGANTVAPFFQIQRQPEVKGEGQ
jgi:regulator of protease activity HflC (stomatin/prohibitin superfamily)